MLGKNTLSVAINPEVITAALEAAEKFGNLASQFEVGLSDTVMLTGMTEWHFPSFLHSVRAHCGRNASIGCLVEPRVGPEIFVLS